MELFRLLNIINPHQRITVTKRTHGQPGDVILFSGILQDWNPPLNDVLGLCVDCVFFHCNEEFSVTVY